MRADSDKLLLATCCNPLERGVLGFRGRVGSRSMKDRRGSAKGPF